MLKNLDNHFWMQHTTFENSTTKGEIVHNGSFCHNVFNFIQHLFFDILSMMF